jgi:hypothetical protein
VKLREIADTPPWEWPSDAGDTFKSFLRNRNAPDSDRILAAELAGEIVAMDDEIAGLLLGIIKDPAESDKLRAQSAVALGPVLEQTDTDRFDDDILPEEYREEPPITEESFEQIKSTLHDVYKDESMPKLVRRRALEASVRADSDWHAGAIRKAYANPDEEWKLTAVFAMQYVPGFDREILEALSSPNKDIHYEAIHAAGNRELSEAWPHIKGLLQSSGTPKQLLLCAIGASPNVNPGEAGPALIDLSESEDEEIAEAAQEAMMEADSMRHGGEDEEWDEDEEDDESKSGGYVN